MVFLQFFGLINQSRGSYRGIPVMRDWLILFSVKREFNKLFFVIRDLKVLRDPWRTWIINRYSWFHHSIWRDFEMRFWGSNVLYIRLTQSLLARLITLGKERVRFPITNEHSSLAVFTKKIAKFAGLKVVCYTAVISVVTQLPSPGEERCVTTLITAV